MRDWTRRSPKWMAALILLTAAACGEAPTQPQVPLGRAALSPSSGISVDLNPQPEPPSSAIVLDFSGSFDGPTFYGGLSTGDLSCGTFELDGVQQQGTGEASHLTFTLQITGANPDFALTADVSGIANQENGLLSLNGVVTDGVLAGSHTHVQGAVTASEGGALAGQLILRPLPMPPGAANGLVYPPSPCAS